jgi:hypothetical protein
MIKEIIYSLLGPAYTVCPLCIVVKDIFVDNVLYKGHSGICASLYPEFNTKG